TGTTTVALPAGTACPEGPEMAEIESASNSGKPSKAPPIAPSGTCRRPTETRRLASPNVVESAGAPVARRGTGGETCGADAVASPSTVLAYATPGADGLRSAAPCPDTGANATLDAGV